MIRKIIFLSLIFVQAILFAQNLFPVTTISVKSYNKELLNPWVGGMNNPELSPINLNRDSFPDLFIFDKDGYKINTYINMGMPDSPMYLFKPIFQKNFPELTKLALIRDYNNDGVDDIYTSAIAGIKLLKGTYLGGSNFSYQVIDSPLVFITSGFEVNVYNANDDLPGIRDIDKDGDLDVLVNSIFGQSYELYKNKSMELYGYPDTSIYELSSTCWGHFYEDASNNKLLLGACKSDEIFSRTDTIGSYRHSGCTIELFDQDNDNDLEILLGDPGFTAIVYGKNGGSTAAATIVSQDTTFPVYDTKINIPIFPATFYLDVNNDHKGDIIACPNIEQTSLNTGNVWYYKNTGPDTNQQFILQNDSFLVGDMIDVGRNSKPIFFDYNNDTLLDILISNEGYFNKNTSSTESKLCLYKNIGTVDTPKFELVTRDYQGLFALSLLDMKHTLGDIDADGDQDLLIGDADGQFNLFYNTPSGGIADFTMVPPVLYLEGIDVGQRANPFLYDIDKDGDLDILVGRLDGKISYYWNFGTPVTYKFDLDSVNANFGKINVTNNTSHPDGNASVYVKDSVLYVGCQYGNIATYTINSDSLRTGTFAKITTKFANIRDGYNSNIDIADLNKDGLLEYITGNSRGGITMYSEADWDTIIPSPFILSNHSITKTAVDFQIYPNPANEQITIQCNLADMQNIQLHIYNIKGQEVLYKKMNEIQNIISVKEFESGIYFIRLGNEKSIITKKLVIHK